MNTSDLPSNPVWLVFCEPQGLECYQPNPPELDGDTTADNQQSQTLLIKATKTLNFEADVAIWEVAKWTGGTPFKYEFTSRDAIPSGLAEATVRYGAAGLEAGTDYTFRVTFCHEVAPGTIDKCTCTSEYSNIISTSSLDGAAPTAPLIQNVEDQFRRKNTNKTNTGGEGIGAPEVWLELSSGTTGRQTIVDNERVAVAPSAPILYVAKSAASGHSYTEVLYKRDPGYTGSDYNVDVLARAVLSSNSTQAKSYAVKLVNESAVVTPPGSGAELQIRRRVGAAQSAAAYTVKVANLLGTNCTATVPLATNGSTEGVWVRIEVKGTSAQDPQIKGEIAWGGCTETGTLASCTSHCYFDFWPDANDPAGMKGEEGYWGYFAHHRDYRIEGVRAGSANPQ